MQNQQTKGRKMSNPTQDQSSENTPAKTPWGFGKILAMPNDSTIKTIVIATLVCLVCAIFVSVASVALKPLQILNKSLDKKKKILQVAGLYKPGQDIQKAFEKIEIRIIDLETGQYTDAVNAQTYDARKAAKDPKYSVKISKKDDVANIHARSKYMPVYLVKSDDKITQVILPISGYGLWSTLYGFLALESDGQTIVGISFYEHAETPGLGGEVDNPKWRGLWKGKKVFDSAGRVAISVIKGNVNPNSTQVIHQIDGLAGATLTSRGVDNMLKYWLGKQGYQGFLQLIQANYSSK